MFMRICFAVYMSISCTELLSFQYHFLQTQVRKNNKTSTFSYLCTSLNAFRGESSSHSPPQSPSLQPRYRGVYVLYRVKRYPVSCCQDTGSCCPVVLLLASCLQTNLCLHQEYIPCWQAAAAATCPR